MLATLNGKFLGSRSARTGAAIALSVGLLAGCAGNRSSSVGPGTANFVDEGQASYYSDAYQGKRTASGERYDRSAMTAAHPSLPFGTRVEVINLDNGREVVVRINDRGPFVRGRIIDLSYRAAEQLGMIRSGTAPVRVRAVN
ncbi:septal ring lytic transglycosylase RlpA family protein [Modicisalibacter ilicicola]|nr:septal ring lytic transglycosylase RlpA family protein [Halomonas ilicicola]